MNREAQQSLITDPAPVTSEESTVQTEVELLRHELDEMKDRLANSQRLVNHYRAVVAVLLAEKPVPLVLSRILRLPVGNRAKEELAATVGERLDTILRNHFPSKNYDN